MSKTISLDGGLVNQAVLSKMADEQEKETGVKAVYLKTTQSHKKGDVINYDDSLLNHRQLKERGFLKVIEEETKIAGPEETKIAGPEETTEKKKPRGKKSDKK